MPLADLTSRHAVLEAIKEFDRHGRDKFLAKYGFGRARTYFLVRGSKHYDSKAIAGVAYGKQFPNRDSLQPADFSGGDRTVKRKLEKLGFKDWVILRAKARK